MESGELSEINGAQEVCRDFIRTRLGFCPIYFGSPSPSWLEDPLVPLSVKQAYERLGSRFLDSQKNLVMELGQPESAKPTVMFNFHLDTVGGTWPVTFGQGRFEGRGAVDMKGPAVALLAGIEGALEADPNLSEKVRILIQSVSGEEGGAMGVYGTRGLAKEGFIGDLNLFVEPTGGYYFDRSTTSMTARIAVDGLDSTDDCPEKGQNATLLLGFLAQRITRLLSKGLESQGVKWCVAGIHTGTMHNKVYGSGSLWFNLAYPSETAARIAQEELSQAYRQALRDFKHDFQEIREAQSMIKGLEERCRLEWIKKGLPVLENRSPKWEAILKDAGICRLPEEMDAQRFTCDAMWVQEEGVYTVVFGPGSLEKNHAHAENEFIEERELEHFAQQIKRLLLCISEKTSDLKSVAIP